MVESTSDEGGILKMEPNKLTDLQRRTLKPESNYRWVMMFLCMGAIAVNYIDRVNIAIAAPTLMKVFNLSTTEMGILMSAFFWSYVLCMMPAGALLNRVGAKIVMGGTCLAWGLSTMLTSLVSGYNSFFAVRVLLGISEAPAYPSCARVVSVWIPRHERTTASAMFDCAARIGSAFTPPIVAWVLITWGWRASFVITGGFAVLYAFVWWAFYHEPDDHPKVTQSELDYIRQDEVIGKDGKVETGRIIPILELFTYPKVLLLCAGSFCYNYFWGVFTTWIPAYLVVSKGLDLKAMGIAAMYPYAAGASMELVGGYLSDKAQLKGFSLNAVRRTGMGLGLLGGAFFMYLAVTANSAGMTILFLTLAMGIYSFGAANTWSMPNDIAPYGQGGGVAGVMNTTGQMATLAAPLVTGYVISTSWGYDGALYIVCVVAVIGSIFYIVNDYSRLIPKEK